MHVTKWAVLFNIFFEFVMDELATVEN